MNVDRNDTPTLPEDAPTVIMAVTGRDVIDRWLMSTIALLAAVVICLSVDSSLRGLVLIVSAMPCGWMLGLFLRDYGLWRLKTPAHPDRQPRG